MLARSKFQQSTSGILIKWPQTYCMLRRPISKHIPIKILKNDQICESTAVVTVKICITNTVHVHLRDSDYQTRMEAVQMCTDTCINTYILIYKHEFVSRLNINIAEQNKFKLAFTDCTRLIKCACYTHLYLSGVEQSQTEIYPKDECSPIRSCKPN